VSFNTFYKFCICKGQPLSWVVFRSFSLLSLSYFSSLLGRQRANGLRGGLARCTFWKAFRPFELGFFRAVRPLPDNPAKAKFLTPREKGGIVVGARPGSGPKVTWHGFGSMLKGLGASGT